MKTNKLFLGLALVAFGVLACDNESVQLNTTEPETELNISYKDMFAEIANSLGVDVTFESVEVFHGLCPEFIATDFESDRITLRNSAVKTGWDVDNSTSMRLATSSGDSFTAITTPHKDNPNTVSHMMMSSAGEAVSIVVDFNFDEINGTMHLVLNDELEPIDISELRAGTFCGIMMGSWSVLIGWSMKAGAVTGGVAFGVGTTVTVLSVAICAMVGTVDHQTTPPPPVFQQIRPFQ
jgi:hypothetical protein